MAVRNQWLTKVYKTLDDIHADKSSTAAAGRKNLRVPAGRGRKISDLPDKLRKSAPPPCTIDSFWRDGCDEDLASYGWDDVQDPDGWGPFATERDKFATW